MKRDNLELPLYMTARDIQRHLQIGRSKAYDLMKDKSFPAIRIGKSVRVKGDDFSKWLDSRKNSINFSLVTKPKEGD